MPTIWTYLRAAAVVVGSSAALLTGGIAHAPGGATEHPGVRPDPRPGPGAGGTRRPGRPVDSGAARHPGAVVADGPRRAGGPSDPAGEGGHAGAAVRPAGQCECAPAADD